MRSSFHNVRPSIPFGFTWILILLLPVISSAQGGPSGPSMPIIDMHFHTLWDGPEQKEALTGFISPKTPDALRRLNMAAVNRYHIVKVVASGDQLSSYEQERRCWGPEQHGLRIAYNYWRTGPVDSRTIRSGSITNSVEKPGDSMPFISFSKMRYPTHSPGMCSVVSVG